MSTNVCFVGGSRYNWPLDQTSEKKFRALGSLGAIAVVGFSGRLMPRRFYQHVQFYLLPDFPLAAVRYLEVLLIAPVLLLWLIVRHGLRVIVAQSPYEGAAGAVAKIIARFVGREVALVVESHGDFEESLFMQRRVFLPSLYRYAMRRVASFAFEYGDVFRTISTSTSRQLEKWATGRPTVQFPAWTDIDVFLQAGNEDRGEHDGRDIVYTGVLIPRKGVHHLVEAFELIANDFKNARLVVIGEPVNSSYAANLKTTVKKLGLDTRVLFFPAMPQADLAKWMRSARVFVLPSLSEGLGRVVFEAMASGTPVIGSAVGGIPDLIEDGRTGFLVSPGDETKLAEKIRWMLEHPSEAREMGRRARKASERLFSTEAYVRSYRDLFELAYRECDRSGQHAAAHF